MSELSIENLTWDYDFKQILLGKNYDENANPILNILKAKRGNIKIKDKYNYQDKTTDYHLNKYSSRGHIENYKLIEEVFQKLLLGNTDCKDVMNSFWNTYKFSLQIKYPNVFVSVKEAEKLNFNSHFSLEEGRDPTQLRSPTLGSINSKITDYYNSPNNKVTALKLIVEENETWINFLINNFDQFDEVHDCPKLKKFAKLTHTIGNIAVIPIGFNRGRAGYDYWDWGLEYLKEFLEPINAWHDYIDIHAHHFYVKDYDKKDDEIIPFWKNHLNLDTDNSDLIPKNEKNIESFLDIVNACIESRGIEIIERIRINKKR